jgi:hypothetical protein
MAADLLNPASFVRHDTLLTSGSHNVERRRSVPAAYRIAARMFARAAPDVTVGIAQTRLHPT